MLLDFDLADLYEVETKVLNQAVKRNIKRFPGDFMFRLNLQEWEFIRSQIVTAYTVPAQRSQIVTFEKWPGKYSKYPPYAFTEQGVAMLSGILNSEKAIQMNIAIMRAFAEIRRILLQESDTREQLRQIHERINDPA